MRQRQRRDSAREWIGSGAAVSVKAYAKRDGVDRYTAYDDLTALGYALPISEQQWAKRPPATPRRKAGHCADPVDDESLIMLDGRLFYVAGYTSGGAPYGVFIDETPSDEMSCDEMPCGDDPF